MLALLLQRRLIIIFVILLLIVAALFFFFSSQKSSQDQKVTLTYWGLWEPKETIQPYLDKFHQENPNITVNYEQRSLTGYRSALVERIKAGTGPDIFKIHNTWLPQLSNLQNLILAPVPTNIYSNEQIEKDFYKTVTESLSVATYDNSGKVTGRKYYALPLQFDSLAIVYNENLVNNKKTDLENANINWPPKTWQDFRRAAQILTERDVSGIRVAGAALGTTGNVDNFSDIVALLFLQSQVQFLEGKNVKIHNTIGKTDGRNVGADALRFYTEFAMGDNRVWDDNLPNSTLAFADGKAAMIIIPSWRLLDIMEYQKASGIKFNYKTALVPQLPDNPPTYWATYWADSVSVKAKNQEAAWKFVKFLAQNETMKSMYADQAKLRSFGELYSRRDLADSLKDNALLLPYLQSASEARSWYLASRTRDGNLNDKNIEYLTNAINSVRKTGSDPQAAIKNFAQGVSQVLSNLGLANQLQL